MKKHHVRGETMQIILYFVLANMYDRVEVITLTFKKCNEFAFVSYQIKH